MTYSPAPQDLTTVANVQAWLNLGSAVDAQVIQRLITSESVGIQNWLNRNIAVQSYTEVRDGSGMGVGRYSMAFTNYPATAVASLTIDDNPIPASSDGAVLVPGYAFDAYRIWLAETGSAEDSGYSNQYYFNRGRANVKIVYTAGFASVPFDIEQACIELVALRYNERSRVGLVSKGLAGETTAFAQRAMSDSIMTKLRQYQRVVPL